MTNFIRNPSGSGNFTDPKWTTPGHPLAGDNATLAGSTSYTVTIDPGATLSYGAILVSDPLATLVISKELTGSLTLTNGTVLLNSSLDLLGAATFTGGHFNVGTGIAAVTIASSLLIGAGATLEAGTTANVSLTGPGNLTNAGTLKIDANPTAFSPFSSYAAIGVSVPIFTNTGAIQIGKGGVVDVMVSNLTNTGTVSVAPTALVLFQGAILPNLAGGVVNVASGGMIGLMSQTFTTPELWSFLSPSGGVDLQSGATLLLETVNVNNDGNVLDFTGGPSSLPPTIGLDGSITGGTVIAGTHMLSPFMSPMFVLKTLTLEGTLDLTAPTLAVLESVTMAPTSTAPTVIHVTGPGAMLGVGGPEYWDNVDIVLGNASGPSSIARELGPTSLTLGVHGTVDQTAAGRYAYIVLDTLANQGTILGEASGFGTAASALLVEATLIANGTTGQFLVDNGDDVSVTGYSAFDNAGTVLVGSNPSYAQSSLSVAASTMTNTGLIISDDAFVYVQSATLGGSGMYVARDGGTLDLLGTSFTTPTNVQFGTGSNTVILGNSSLFSGTVANFGVGDRIILAGTVETDFTVSGETLLVRAGNTLVTIRTSESFVNTPTFKAVNGLAGVTITNNGILSAACYARGTRILTDRGERAVETLRPDDHVITLHRRGALPIRWIGSQQIDLTRHAMPTLVRPVRVVRDAFGQGLPHRDLILSPEHAVFLDGALIPVRFLVDSRSVRFEARASVEYFHIELDRHDIVIAEGLPAETWLDTGNRAMFDDGLALTTLFADFGPNTADDAWRLNACAPMLTSGPRFDAIRRRVAAMRLPPRDACHSAMGAQRTVE